MQQNAANEMAEELTAYDPAKGLDRMKNALGPGFALIETMHATRALGVRHLERHGARLAHSARFFDFQYDHAEILTALAAATHTLPLQGAYRLRLSLSKEGVFDLSAAPLAPLVEPVHVFLASDADFAAVDPDELWLRHKSAQRARNTRAVQKAEQWGAFDLLFLNTRGELTEGARANVFVKLDGRWFTPPLSSGLLPGVMRAVLLDDREWNAAERVLTVADLHVAEKIVVCNALRGAVEARLLNAPHSARA